MIQRTHTLYLPEGPNDKLLLAKKLLSFLRLLASQVIQDLGKPAWLLVLKVKLLQLIWSQLSAELRLDTLNKILLTWVKMTLKQKSWMKWEIISPSRKFSMKRFQIKNKKFRRFPKMQQKSKNLLLLRNTLKKWMKKKKRKHKMKKKQQHMKTLQFKRKRRNKFNMYKLTDNNSRVNKFNSNKRRKRLFNKFSRREVSGLQLKVTLGPCHKCFLTDKSAMVGAGSHTTILKGEGARVHWKCLLAN